MAVASPATRIPMQQDDAGDGSLPTYDDLRTREGPNSRFGRWQQWIEKRAAERYADDAATPRRRNRGWGDPALDNSRDDLASPEDGSFMHFDAELPTPDLERTPTYPPESSPTMSSSQRSPFPSNGQRLRPCHLDMHAFGSRFIPHSETPIKAILPLLGERFILLGHSEGLGLLDVFPEETIESNTSDAKRREIWRGEGVSQMVLLEHETTGSRTPQGVVLALVNTDCTETPAQEGKDPSRSIRMYNLASLISLVRWAVSRKDNAPVDLRRTWSPQDGSFSKKHGRHRSLIKGLRGLATDSVPCPVAPVLPAKDAHVHPLQDQPPPVPPKSLPASPSTFSVDSPTSARPSASRLDSLSSIDTTWDVIDDLPIRWATDFVPLATPNSRLTGISVSFFEAWKHDDGSGRTMLAIATRTNILLYETVKATRAFRFVKEFYTPIPARNIAFIYQRPSESPSRASSQSMPIPRRGEYTDRSSSLHEISPGKLRSGAISQLSLFVTFDRKAGLIRIADSSVSELDLWDDAPDTQVSPHASFRRSIATLDAFGFGKDGRAPWLPLACATLPVSSNVSPVPVSQTVHLLTRGKTTHVLPAPLPVPLSAHAPVHIVRWKTQPSHVVPRVCDVPGGLPFLQVVAFGGEGVEVQELPLNFMSGLKGKGRADLPTVSTHVDVGGPAGFLAVGGQWHDPHGFAHNLYRSNSINSLDSAELVAFRNSREGMYGTAQRDLEDFRIFWLGGDAHARDDGENDNELH